jgi:Ni/Co efflux regulator RcnB
MKRLFACVIALTLLGSSLSALADGRRHDRDHWRGGDGRHHGRHYDRHYDRHDDRRHDRHRYRHHGYRHGGRVDYYYAPRYYSEPAYYYDEPVVHYHYRDGGYHRHHGDCGRAFMWIGGAMVLTELIHHAGRH